MLIYHALWYPCFIVIIMVVSWIFLSQIVYSEEYKINNFTSLNVTLLNKEISLEEPQIINFLLSDKSLNNKTDNYGIINGNIIYLSGIAQSFYLNISNSKLSTYSWIVDPKIQKFGTVLIEIDLIYNGSKIHIDDLPFNIVKGILSNKL